MTLADSFVVSTGGLLGLLALVALILLIVFLVRKM